MKTLSSLMLMLFALSVNSQTDKSVKKFEKDIFETDKGDLSITFIGHSSLEIQAGWAIIYIDPSSDQADYSSFPKADMILITHEHSDHLDLKAVNMVSKPKTTVIVSKSCAGQIATANIFVNGSDKTFGDINITAVPAYNIVNTDNGRPYHVKGEGNGYVIAYGGKKIYVAGDTEKIPEMATLKNIDIAFLPMALPYTMTAEMVSEAARSFMPKILYPYHMLETNPQILIDLLKGSKIEVRVRKMI